MHQRKGKKTLIYFFLLIIVGSINNIGFSKIKFNNINNINITGLSNIENETLNKEIKSLNLESIFFINANKIKVVIDSNNLVEKYIVYKKYPTSIDIKITKTNFLAKINYEDKNFLVGSNGKLSNFDYYNTELPFIFGRPEISDFLQFKKIIDESKFSYTEVENLYFFPSKRWDLELKNNIIIKLSDDNIKESISLATKFLHSDELKNAKMIDARIKNQIILND